MALSVSAGMETSTFITEDKFRDCTNKIFYIILLIEKEHISYNVLICHKNKPKGFICPPNPIK